jgi:hypothetical protein
MAINQMQGYPIGNSRVRLSWGRSQNNSGVGTPYRPAPPPPHYLGMPAHGPGAPGPYGPPFPGAQGPPGPQVRILQPSTRKPANDFAVKRPRTLATPEPSMEFWRLLERTVCYPCGHLRFLPVLRLHIDLPRTRHDIAKFLSGLFAPFRSFSLSEFPTRRPRTRLSFSLGSAGHELALEISVVVVGSSFSLNSF